MKDMFKSEFLAYLFYSVDFNLSMNDKAVFKKYYKDCENSMSAEGLMRYLKSSTNFELFVQSMNELQESKLYLSDIHGKSHIERTAVYSFYIADKLKLTEEEFLLVLEAVKYHDIGRNSDREDYLHGYIGANMAEKVCKGFDKTHLEIIKGIIAAHSVGDKEYISAFSRFNINPKDYKKIKLYLGILKDSDC